MLRGGGEEGGGGDLAEALARKHEADLSSVDVSVPVRLTPTGHGLVVTARQWSVRRARRDARRAELRAEAGNDAVAALLLEEGGAELSDETGEGQGGMWRRNEGANERSGHGGLSDDGEGDSDTGSDADGLRTGREGGAGEGFGEAEELPLALQLRLLKRSYRHRLDDVLVRPASARVAGPLRRRRRAGSAGRRPEPAQRPRTSAGGRSFSQASRWPAGRGGAPDARTGGGAVLPSAPGARPKSSVCMRSPRAPTPRYTDTTPGPGRYLSLAGAGATLLRAGGSMAPAQSGAPGASFDSGTPRVTSLNVTRYTRGQYDAARVNVGPGSYEPSDPSLPRADRCVPRLFYAVSRDRDRRVPSGGGLAGSTDGEPDTSSATFVPASRLQAQAHGGGGNAGCGARGRTIAPAPPAPVREPEAALTPGPGRYEVLASVPARAARGGALDRAGRGLVPPGSDSRAASASISAELALELDALDSAETEAAAARAQADVADADLVPVAGGTAADRAAARREAELREARARVAARRAARARQLRKKAREVRRYQPGAREAARRRRADVVGQRRDSVLARARELAESGRRRAEEAIEEKRVRLERHDATIAARRWLTVTAVVSRMRFFADAQRRRAAALRRLRAARVITEAWRAFSFRRSIRKEHASLRRVVKQRMPFLTVARRMRTKRRAAATIARFLTNQRDVKGSLLDVLLNFRQRVRVIQRAWRRFAAVVRAQEEAGVRQLDAFDRRHVGVRAGAANDYYRRSAIKWSKGGGEKRRSSSASAAASRARDDGAGPGLLSKVGRCARTAAIGAMFQAAGSRTVSERQRRRSSSGAPPALPPRQPSRAVAETVSSPRPGGVVSLLFPASAAAARQARLLRAVTGAEDEDDGAASDSEANGSEACGDAGRLRRAPSSSAAAARAPVRIGGSAEFLTEPVKRRAVGRVMRQRRRAHASALRRWEMDRRRHVVQHAVEERVQLEELRHYLHGTKGTPVSVAEFEDEHPRPFFCVTMRGNELMCVLKAAYADQVNALLHAGRRGVRGRQ